MANNLLTAAVLIRGTRPLWQHGFGPDALPLEKQERTGVAGNDPNEWRKTCMVTDEGQLYLDGSYIFGAIRQGAAYTKRSRGNIQKPVAATLQVTTDRILLNRYYPGFPNGHAFRADKIDPPTRDIHEPVYLDVRGVVNPSTKGRNVRYRLACSPGWEATFEIVWDKTIVSRGEMEAAVIDTGKLVGLGSGRSIGRGRFEVIEFRILE